MRCPGPTPPFPALLFPTLPALPCLIKDLQEFCGHAADHEHKRVVLAGLDGDFQRQRFGQVG